MYICRCEVEWKRRQWDVSIIQNGWMGEEIKSQWLVHRLLPCSDEYFISITIQLVGYLLSPSCRLMVMLVSHTGLDPGDNSLHCVSFVSLLQLNNNTINCDCFQFSQNDCFHLWNVNSDAAALPSCCCYIKSLYNSQHYNWLHGKI